MRLRIFAQLLKRTPSAKSRLPADISSEHAYLHGRFEYERLFGDIARSRAIWQGTALITLAVNIVIVIGFVVVASQHKTVPYIIEVDDLGQIHAIGQLMAADPPERAMQASLIRWINDMRTVPTDVHLLNVQLKRAQAYVAGDAAEQFSREMRAANDRFSDMLREGTARYVNAVTHVLPLPGPEMIFRVAWQETVVNTTLRQEDQQGYEGHFHLQALSPPQEGDQLLHNPLGIYVTSYAWAAITTMDETAGRP